MANSDIQAQASHPTEVIIVGAGPTGLMAAALLARCGVSFRIFDKSETAAHESRAFGVQAKSLELFLNMGLAEAVLNKGLIATGAQIFVDSQQKAELNFDDIGRADTPYPFILMVPQSDIEAILLEDVEKHGIEVERGVEVLGFEQSTDKVILHAKDKAGNAFDVSASYLIGADGAHSIVRHILGLSFEGAPYPQGFMLADCKADWALDYDHLKIFLRGNNMAVFMPLRGTDIVRIIAMETLAADENESIGKQGSSAISLAEVQNAFAEASGLDVKLYDPVWTSRYRVHHRAVDRYRQGRAFVAGDAAHIHSPAGGQGMNTGLQDAANLAWKLALLVKGHSQDGLLETYHAERWPVGQNVLKTTDRLFGNMTVRNEWQAKIRNFLIPILFGALTRSRLVRAKVFHFLSQLAIRYEINPFLYDSGLQGATSIGAGIRAPDARITRDISLFNLIKGYQFHILAISRISLSEAEISHLLDRLATLPASTGIPIATHLVTNSLIGRDPRLHRAESPDIFEAYGIKHSAPQALFLIRPDGYIAFHTNQLAIEGLRDFLTTRFGRFSYITKS